MSAVTVLSGRTTAQIVWDWAADLWSCGGKGPVSKTAARLTDECSSVGRTQLSDTGVGDELTVVGQVTRGVAGQGPVDKSRYLEYDALPHMKPVQLLRIPESRWSWCWSSFITRRMTTELAWRHRSYCGYHPAGHDGHKQKRLILSSHVIFVLDGTDCLQCVCTKRGVD